MAGMEPNPYQSPSLPADVPQKKQVLGFIKGAVLTLLIVPAGALAILAAAIFVEYSRWCGF